MSSYSGDDRSKLRCVGVLILVLTLSAAGSDILLQTPPSSPVSLIEYRMIGGTLDFYFFSGPSPQKVIEQYGELVGLPTWQPAWGFGFHLCRWGYKDVNDTKEQVTKMREAGIPLEGTWFGDFQLLELNSTLCSAMDGYRLVSRCPRFHSRSCVVSS